MGYLTSRTINFKFNPTPFGIKRSGNPPTTAAAIANQPAANNYTRTGLCAIIGNCDDGNDIIQPGAFTKAVIDFNAGRSRIRHLWNHIASNPPIASVKALTELTRSQMPDFLLARDPNISGGLLVTREYYPGNELSEWVLTAIDRGDIKEMSFGYNVLRDSFKTINNKRVRLLEELEILDSSDVVWGMNSATVAVISKSFPPPAPQKGAESLDQRFRRLQMEKFRLDCQSVGASSGASASNAKRQLELNRLQAEKSKYRSAQAEDNLQMRAMQLAEQRLWLIGKRNEALLLCR